MGHEKNRQQIQANEPTIRLATLDDLPSIIALLGNDKLGQLRERVDLPPDHKYLEAFSAIEKDDNQLLVILEINGSVGGCLQLSFIPGLSRTGMWRAQIESVRIAENLRTKEYGKYLIRAGKSPPLRTGTINQR